MAQTRATVAAWGDLQGVQIMPSPFAKIDADAAASGVSDPAHLRFGEGVDLARTGGANLVFRDAAGLVRCQETADDDEMTWTTAKRVRPQEKTAWLQKKREGAGRDCRLIRKQQIMKQQRQILDEEEAKNSRHNPQPKMRGNKQCGGKHDEE